MWGINWSLVFWHRDIQFQFYLLKRLSFLHWITLHLCQKLIDHVYVGLFLNSILFHWCICLCLDHYVFIKTLKLGSINCPTLFCFKVVLAFLGLLCFHMNFRISLLMLTLKIFPGILIRIVLDLWVNLRDNGYLNKLTILIYESIFLHLFI